MAAALSLSHPLHGHPRHPRKPRTRSRSSLSCRGHMAAGPPDPGEDGEGKREDKAGKGEARGRALFRLYTAAERVGKGLKENLSPQRKGDWKDVLLMSLSFAIYVYVSQKLVCAYCAWMSMLHKF